jgi:hypothetical protein
VQTYLLLLILLWLKIKKKTSVFLQCDQQNLVMPKNCLKNVLFAKYFSAISEHDIANVTVLKELLEARCGSIDCILSHIEINALLYYLCIT